MGRSPVRVSIFLLNEPRRVAVGGTLRRAGFQVDFTENQQSAVSGLVDDPPDVLIIDRFSPDGEDVLLRLSALRLEIGATGACVLLLSGEPPSLEDQKMALEIGAVTFLTDSNDEREIFTALRRALTAKQAESPFTATSQVQVLADEDWQSDTESSERRKTADAADDRSETVPPFPGYQERLVGREKVLNKLRRMLEPDSVREPGSAPLESREDIVETHQPGRERSAHLDKTRRKPPDNKNRENDEQDARDPWTWQDYETDAQDQTEERSESQREDRKFTDADARKIIDGFFDDDE